MLLMAQSTLSHETTDNDDFDTQEAIQKSWTLDMNKF